MNSKKHQKQSYPTKEGIVVLPKLQTNLHESVVMKKGRVPHQGSSLPMRRNQAQASSSASIQQVQHSKGENYSSTAHQVSSLRVLSQHESKGRLKNTLLSKQKLPSHHTSQQHSLSYQSITNMTNRHVHLGSLDTLDLRPHKQSTFSTLQQPSKNSVQTDQQQEYVRRNNPSMLLLQHNQCKNENRERLKKVKNLEDLINFKVVTIADKFKQEQDQLNAISNADYSTLGGPLSPNYNNSLMTNQPGATTENSLLSPQNNQTSIMVTQTTQNGTASVSQATSLNVLKRICDPLLANNSLPKLKIGTSKSKKTMNKINSKLNDQYEIPEDLKRMPRNYNSTTKIPVLENQSLQLPSINLKKVKHVDEAKGALTPREDGSEKSPERLKEDQGDQLILNLKSYFAERGAGKAKAKKHNSRPKDQLKTSLSLQRRELMKLYKLEELKFQQNQQVINSQLDLFHQILNNDLNRENHKLASQTYMDMAMSETGVLEKTILTNEQWDAQLFVDGRNQIDIMNIKKAEEHLQQSVTENKDGHIKDLTDSANDASSQPRNQMETIAPDGPIAPKVKPRYSSIKQIQSVKANSGTSTYIQYSEHQKELIRQYRNQNKKRGCKQTTPRAVQQKPKPSGLLVSNQNQTLTENTMTNIVLLTRSNGEPEHTFSHMFEMQPNRIEIVHHSYKNTSCSPTVKVDKLDDIGSTEQQHGLRTEQDAESPEDGMAMSLHEYIMKQEKENPGGRVKNQPEKLDLFLTGKNGANPGNFEIHDRQQSLPLNIELEFADKIVSKEGNTSCLPRNIMNSNVQVVETNESLQNTMAAKSQSDQKRNGAESPSEVSTIKQSVKRIGESDPQKDFNEQSVSLSRSESKHMIIIQGQNLGDIELKPAKALKSSFPIVKQNDNTTKNRGTGVDSSDSLLSPLQTQKSKVTIIPNATNINSQRTNPNGNAETLASVSEPHLSQPISMRDNSLSPRIIKYAGVESPQPAHSPGNDSVGQPFNVMQVQVTNDNQTKAIQQAEQLQILDNMIYDEIINDHLIKRAQWIPSRFNKFPRFGKSTQKQTEMEKQFIKMRQFISLNPHITNLLNQGNITFIMNMLEIPVDKQKEILALTPPNPDLDLVAEEEPNSISYDAAHLQKQSTESSVETKYMSTLKVTEQINSRNLTKQQTADQRNERTIESASASTRKTNESRERDTQNTHTLELQKTVDSKHDRVNGIEDVRADRQSMANTELSIQPPHGPPVQTNSNVNVQAHYHDRMAADREPPRIEHVEAKPLTQKQIDNLIQIIKMNLETYPNNLPEEPRLSKNSILSASNKVVHNRLQTHQLNEANQKKVGNQKLYVIHNEKQKTEELDIQGRKQLISRLQEMSGKKMGEMKMQNQFISIKVQNAVEGHQKSGPGLRNSSIVEVAHGGAETMKKSFVIHQLLESAREKQISQVADEEQRGKNAGRYLGPTTQAKYERNANKAKFPMAVLDMTAGHTQEEPGYGYLRPQYVIDRSFTFGYPATRADEGVHQAMPVPDLNQQQKNHISSDKTKLQLLTITQLNELELVLGADNNNRTGEKAKDNTKRMNRKVADEQKNKLMINSYSQQQLERERDKGDGAKTLQNETPRNGQLLSVQGRIQQSSIQQVSQATELPTVAGESHRYSGGMTPSHIVVDAAQNADMFQIYPKYMHQEPRFKDHKHMHKDQKKFQEQVLQDSALFRQSLQNAQQVKQSTNSAFLLSDADNTAPLPSDDGLNQTLQNKMENDQNLTAIPERDFETTVQKDRSYMMTLDSDQIQSALKEMDAQHSIALQAKQGGVLAKDKKQISLSQVNSQIKPSSETSHQNLNSSQNPSYAALHQLNPIQISRVEYRQESQDHKSSHLLSLRTPKLPAQIRLKNSQTKAAKKALTNLKASQQESELKAQDILNDMNPNQANRIKEQVIELGLNLQEIRKEEENQQRTIETIHKLLKKKSQAEVIKGLIDQMYLQEKKYQSNTILRRDLLQTNDMIFHLEKSHFLSNKDPHLSIGAREDSSEAGGNSGRDGGAPGLVVNKYVNRAE